MNCDECQEQVFELIEREAIDPDAVREVLNRCPECRALFDEMKSALASANALPTEVPPAEIDALIVQAARERVPKRVPQRRRWSVSPQWAVAAVALLAIGIGVWAIPRGEQIAMDEASSVPSGASEMDAPAATDDEIRVALQASRAAESIASQGPVQDQAERRAVAQTDGEPVASASPKRAAREALAGGASGDTLSFETPTEEASSAPSAPRAKKEAMAMSADCQKRVSAFRSLLDEHELGAAALLSPEDALALGHCYEEGGDVAEARAFYQLAASHPKTERRALRALKGLSAD
jgi:hypothetical protein